MKKSTTLAIGSVIAVLFIGTVNAEEGKKGKGERSGELKEYREKQQEVRKEYKEQRHEEKQAFHESIKDKEPSEALTAIIANRKSQYTATRTFMEDLHNKLVAYVKETVPAEKQAEVLKKIEERRSEGVAKHEETHEKLIAALEGLQSNEDLTKEQIRKTISEILPDRKGKGEKKGKKNNQE